jgi:hypothetical protein
MCVKRRTILLAIVLSACSSQVPPTREPPPSSTGAPLQTAGPLACSGRGYGPDAVVDTTGLLESCTSGQRNADQLDRGPVYNLPGDPSKLVVEFLANVGSECRTAATITFAHPASAGYAISAEADDVPCSTESFPVVRAVTMQLREPVQVDEISTFDGAPVPATRPLPTLAPYAEVANSDYRLSLHAGAPVHNAGEPITDITAELTYTGQQQTVRVSGGHFLIRWRLEQLDGPFDPTGAGSTDCGEFTFGWGRSAAYDSFRKQGGFEPGDPLSLLGYNGDSELRLPPGTWRITAAPRLFSNATCAGAPTDLTASIVIRTVDPTLATPIPSPTPQGSAIDCHTNVMVHDETALIDSCYAATPAESNVDLAVQNADPTTLRVIWLANVCDKDYDFHFRQVSVGYELAGQLAPAVCFAMFPNEEEIRLRLNAPGDASTVTGTMNYIERPPNEVEACPWPPAAQIDGFDRTNSQPFCRSGELLPPAQISLVSQGAGKCGWQSVAFLDIGKPFVTPPDGSTFVQYVRDPNGLLTGAGVGPLQTIATISDLPHDSGETGITNGNVTLIWSDSEAQEAAFALMGSVIERWPRAPHPLACPEADRIRADATRPALGRQRH